MRVVLSWSGGARSALALARLREAGHDVTLAHLTDASTRRDRARGVPDFLVQEQAACLGLPLALLASRGRDDAAALLAALADLEPDAVAFGDAAAGARRAWGEDVARRAGVEALFPLGDAPAEGLAREALARGIRAFVCACRPPLDPSFLGRFLDDDLLARILAAGADPMGARGECRAFVVAGPGFRRRVDATAGEARGWDGGWMLDLGLRGC